MTLFALFLLLFLLLGSMLFAASETALISLSPQKAKALALRTPRVAEALQRWITKPHELLTLILVGNTFVNVLFAALLTIVLYRSWPGISHVPLELLSWLIGTVLIVIVGEMAPKFFARSNPERTSLFVLPWLSQMSRGVTPILNVLIGPLGFFFPKLKTPPVGQMLMFSMEELKSLLEEDLQTGALKDDSMTMMQRILEINDRRAEQIMVPMDQVDFIEIDPAGGSPRDRELLIDLIVEEGHTRTPIKWQGEFVGFVHADDLMASVLFDRQENVTRFIRKAVEVSADRRVGDLLQDFRSSGCHLGFVRNQQGAVTGILTLEDVLEEITGEILDEYDAGQPPKALS